ncbi:DUF47 domain-containing protein [Salinarchaeum laminariae]|uniref:DUF47 domain-containing protein n=1 Tax=Salinarchaeum laminariae TaxID=869888 RepID=UPI0020BEF45A|nr:hypothetical protein [Salinarchaeum laminariae]
MAQQGEASIRYSLRELAGTAAECVSLLPTAIRLHAEDDPGFDGVVERCSALETRCDELVQSLRRSVADDRPAFSETYLFAPGLLELAYEVDRIASECEQFVAELEAIDPSLSAAAETSMVEHAQRSAAACDRLSRGVDAALNGEPCRTEIDAIRVAESSCDRLKYQALSDADGTPGEVLLIREFAVTLDAVPNAIEDAADVLGQLRAGGV